MVKIVGIHIGPRCTVNTEECKHIGIPVFFAHALQQNSEIESVPCGINIGPVTISGALVSYDRIVSVVVNGPFSFIDIPVIIQILVFQVTGSQRTVTGISGHFPLVGMIFNIFFTLEKSLCRQTQDISHTPSRIVIVQRTSFFIEPGNFGPRIGQIELDRIAERF